MVDGGKIYINADVEKKSNYDADEDKEFCDYGSKVEVCGDRDTIMNGGIIAITEIFQKYSWFYVTLNDLLMHKFYTLLWRHTITEVTE